MPIIRDQAIIIHSIKHGDSSLIVHVLTRENGRNSLIAKGARSKKPRFGAALEVMSHSEVIQILREARVINNFLPIRDNLERTALGLAVCELLRMVTPVAESSSDIFDISIHALESISSAQKNVRNHFWRFELELFRPLGIGLSLTNCIQCGRIPTAEKDKEVEFDSANGAIRCSECKTGNGFDLAMEAYRVLEFLNRTHIRSVENITISKRAESVIKSMLSYHLRMHLPVHRDLKSLDALKWGST
jgi:DNA repair protein RecO (recombination protein O)